jgi:hypothetical protein
MINWERKKMFEPSTQIAEENGTRNLACLMYRERTMNAARMDPEALQLTTIASSLSQPSATPRPKNRVLNPKN